MTHGAANVSLNCSPNGDSPIYSYANPLGDRTPISSAFISAYYKPATEQFIAWSFPNVAHTGIDIDFKMTGYDWENRTLGWSVDSGPAGMTIDTDGTLHWTPSVDLTTEPVTVGLTFDGVGKITKTFNIPVNNARCLFIATTGNDTTGDGSLANPFATLEKAAEIITAASTGFTVYHRGGTYTKTGWAWYSDTELTQLAGKDWNQTDPIIFRSYPGEAVDYAVTGNGWRMYGSGIIFYDFDIHGATTSETFNLNVGSGSIAVKMSAHDADWAWINNCTGIRHEGGSILHSCTSYNNYDRAATDGVNSADYLYYAENGSGDAFVIDCISDSLGSNYTKCGFKIKHAGLNPVHYHNTVGMGSDRPFTGICNRSSVRHSMFWTDSDESACSHGYTDPTTGGNNDTDEGMLIDATIIVQAGTGKALTMSHWAMLTTPVVSPFKVINSVVNTHSTVTGALFACGTYDALPADWNIDFDNNTVYAAATSTCVTIDQTNSGIATLLAYGSDNVQVAPEIQTKTVNGRTFKISAAGVGSEI